MRPYRDETIWGFVRLWVKHCGFRLLQRVCRNLKIGVLSVDGALVEPWVGIIPVRDEMILRRTTETVSRLGARKRFNVAEESFVVGIMGQASERKCPEVAMEACVSLASQIARPVTLFLPGVCSGTLLENLVGMASSGEVRLVAANRFLDEDEYAVSLIVPDVIVAFHRNEGSSGVVLDAKANSVPLIVGGAASLIRQAEACGYGVACDVDAESLLVALKQVVEGDGKGGLQRRAKLIECPTVSEFCAGTAVA